MLRPGFGLRSFVTCVKNVAYYWLRRNLALSAKTEMADARFSLSLPIIDAGQYGSEKYHVGLQNRSS